MKVIQSIPQIRKVITRAKANQLSIGFVPTMGAFHEGHLSLIRRCRRENDLAVVSIFVNPAQFAPGEDFKAYPREKKKDILLVKKENVDIIFYPSLTDVYPGRYLTYIHVDDITTVLCGKTRPTHFRGVSTVVGKLINIVSPDTIYLGQKDAQQCLVIRQMVRDLNFPVKVKVVPTVREKDGLAMSSRNRYLTLRQRSQAPVLYESLKLARKMVSDGERNPSKIVDLVKRHIRTNTDGRIDYVACVDAETLKRQKNLSGKMMIALAVYFGNARLIDNIIFTVFPG